LDEYGRPAMVNALGSLDVDMILDEGPDTMNIMQDTYDTLVALAQNGAQVPPQVLIEMSSLDSTTKKKILALLDQAGQPDPTMQKAQAVQIEGEIAKTEETRSKTMKNVADAQVMVAEAMRPEPAAEPVSPEAPKAPSQSISFKDIPPEAHSQMLAKVGIYITPE